MDVIMTTDNKVDILVIKLKDQRAGELNRKKNPNLSSKYPECVFIERVVVNYNLRKKSGDAGATATVIQFPVRLSHANTAHKYQGQTVPAPGTVSLDINSVFEPGQAYVMLSRIQCIDQLYILKDLDPSKIRAAPAALEELKRLKAFNAFKTLKAYKQVFWVL